MKIVDSSDEEDPPEVDDEDGDSSPPEDDVDEDGESSPPEDDDDDDDGAEDEEGDGDDDKRPSREEEEEDEDEAGDDEERVSEPPKKVSKASPAAASKARSPDVGPSFSQQEPATGEMADSSSEEDEPLQARIDAIKKARIDATEAPRGKAARYDDGLPAVILMPMDVDSLIPTEQEPFEALRAARASEGDRTGVKRHRIASDRMLCEIVRRVPSTVDDFASVPGMRLGTRTQKYAPMLLAALAPYVAALRAAHARHLKRHGAPLGALSAAGRAAFASLATLRDTLVDKSKQYSETIADDGVLCDVVKRMPRTLRELRRCKGLGPHKIEKYGAALLGALQPHLVRHGPAKRRKRKRKQCDDECDDASDDDYVAPAHVQSAVRARAAAQSAAYTADAHTERDEPPAAKRQNAEVEGTPSVGSHAPLAMRSTLYPVPCTPGHAGQVPAQLADADDETAAVAAMGAAMAAAGPASMPVAVDGSGDEAAVGSSDDEGESHRAADPPPEKTLGQRADPPPEKTLGQRADRGPRRARPFTAAKLRGRYVRVPSAAFPDDAAPATGYWVARVRSLLRQPKGHALLRIEDEEEFHRPVSEILSWEPHA